jgi:RND superfamily putative drug exporter
MDASALLGNSLTNFNLALTQLQTAVAAQLPDATYVPKGMTPEKLQAGAAALQADVVTLETSLRNMAQAFIGRQDNFFVPLSLASGAEAKGLTQLLDTYTTAKGDAARLQIILADQPYSSAAIDTVARLRTTVEKADHGYIYSGTAVLYDLRDAMARDMRKVMLLTLIGIAAVMVLLLRSVVAPLYLMATILLSYGSTLGITRLVFEGFLHTYLTWFVPLFIFTMLMSLGMDYNIFLMGRVKEETAQNGTRLGIQRAMERTGGIITSAGIIMAGTFAAMMVSSLVGLVQLAFAITIGVLLDTFVIRTTLVPAIGMLLGKWNWWPRRGPGDGKQ